MTVNISLNSATLLFVYWTDARLAWNPIDYDEITELLINRNFIWRPNIAILQSTSVSNTRNPDLQQAHVSKTLCVSYVRYQLKVHSNGDISVFVSHVVSISCVLSFKSFPFDSQMCAVTFEADDFFLPAVWINMAINFIGSNEWTIDDVTSKDVIYHVIESGFDSFMGKLTFHFRRNAQAYVFTIVLPSFVIALISLLGMFWSNFNETDYLAKVGCGLSAILALCSILQISQQSMPKTKELPSLTLYIMVNLLLVVVAMLIVVMASKP
ncbi:unnamed protein product [Cylicocyclus nassatus]|uniref:Neurotransmitter-gated ion-channel ligand-binding domain-containing protein n=1 Tax=Cylicocyclus nassatus TaxID=53992 RepID=A0AA36H5T8_CYLNA|nr:unnamed protein product [Cylicocyclus nassatus]